MRTLSQDYSKTIALKKLQDMYVRILQVHVA